MPDVCSGVEIVRKALRMPCSTIAKNAGKDGSVIVEKVLMSPFEIGYDAQRDEFVDMVKAGIIDPTKVGVNGVSLRPARFTPVV